MNATAWGAASGTVLGAMLTAEGRGIGAQMSAISEVGEQLAVHQGHPRCGGIEACSP